MVDNRPSFFIYEPEPEIAALLKDYIDTEVSHNPQVEVIKNPESVVEAAQVNTAGLLNIDGMDLSLLDKLSKQPKFRPETILALTTAPSPTSPSRRRCQELGVSVLLKPFDPDDLVNWANMRVEESLKPEEE